MAHPDIVVVGSYVQDHAWLTDRFPEAGETRRATGFHTGPGGKGFNQAIACHRQGAGTLFIGAVGDDALGASARRFANKEGLACEWQIDTHAPTAASSIIVDAQGRNQIVVALGANERLDPAFVSAQRSRCEGACAVLMQMETRWTAALAALELARAIGALAVLNPAPVHPGFDPAFLAGIDLLTPNETEFCLLLERVTGMVLAAKDVAKCDNSVLHGWCRQLKVATVIITLGAHGCFVSHAADAPLGKGEPVCYRVPPAQVKTIDSTGAGDAFNGALAAALVRLRGQGFRAKAEHANRAAALSTETVGTAEAIVTFEAVQRRFPV